MRAARLTVLTALLWLLATAVPALASSDDGEGLLGELDDKIVTFFSLGVVIFFALFVFLMSLLQGALEKRKEAKKAAAMRRQAGW